MLLTSLVSYEPREQAPTLGWQALKRGLAGPGQLGDHLLRPPLRAHRGHSKGTMMLGWRTAASSIDW